jgi:hypothetical protein
MQFVTFLELFARAGGGGSGSGGGGGGGGGSGADLLALIAWAPSHWLSRLVRRYFEYKTALIITAASGAVVTAALITWAFVYLPSFLGGYIVFCLIAGLWLGWHSAMFGFWQGVARRIKQTRERMFSAMMRDPHWDERKLIAHAKQAFLRYQDDWSRGDASQFHEYMTDHYRSHASLLLRALAEMNRTNTIRSVIIKRAEPTDAFDAADDSFDRFTVAFEASATDILFSTLTGSRLFSSNDTFTEEWEFQRSGNTWLLNNISQETADPALKQQSLIDFAQEYSLYYSLDMGWLYLPRRGVLFKGGKFGKSDINNHIIGLYKDTLVQFYTYSPNKIPGFDYLIAQINLKKSYDNILVVKKGMNPKSKPRGFQQYSLEWEDFNKRYDVYASNEDTIATFELLNPKFMAQLYDLCPDASIEVVDNIVYFYEPLTLGRADTAQYKKYAELLLQAGKELSL